MGRKSSPKNGKRRVYQTMLEDIPSGRRKGGYEGVRYESSKRRGR